VIAAKTHDPHRRLRLSQQRLVPRLLKHNVKAPLNICKKLCKSTKHPNQP
jgi:hypothetical protein